MIGVWENKNIGEKNIMWIFKKHRNSYRGIRFKKYLFTSVEMIFSVSMKLLYHKSGVSVSPSPPKGGCTPKGESL